MKLTKFIYAGLLAGMFTITGCGGGDINISEADSTAPVTPVTPPPSSDCPDFATSVAAIGSFSTVCEVEGTITTDTTLTSDILWVLKDRVAVGNDRADSATLTIEPGTTIIGRSGDDFLVVRRGSQINASGTAAAPITMTSFQDVNGDETGIGQWGGLVLLGNAPANLCDGEDENADADATELANCGVSAEGDAGLYGGDDEDDNSGTLRYVVVKQAGNALAAGDELNGITFAGVGRGTTVEFIQVHENLDDGVEFFGGTVNVKNVVLTGNGDDSFDWAFGWTGKAQFIYIQHNDEAGNRGFESDNSEDFPAATPLTSPMVSNVTVVGGNVPDEDSEGVLLRHGTAGLLRNFVITGPTGMGECLEIDDFDETRANAVDGSLAMTHSVVACDNGENFKGEVVESTQTTEQWFLAQDGNSAYPSSSSLTLGSNGYQPLAGSPLLGSGFDASQDDSFFESTDYIGAFDGTNDWTQGWTVGVRGGFPSDVQNALEQGLATDASSEYPAITDKPVYRLASGTTFVADVTLTNDAHWVLKGRTAVGNDKANSATLYIQAGTTLIGEEGDDFLVARRGSKVEALGTASAPIVMTSVEDVTGQPTAIGQWGGLVLLGNAPTSLCDGDADSETSAAELESCGVSAEGDAGVYGGNDPEDNSGTLRYVIVKFAGNALAAGDELNGITFAGVGRGTTVEYIQVHKNLDDGVEFFGGTVDVRYLVLTANGDDSFDWAFGWTGRAQFVLVKHDAAEGVNRGIEGDNSEDRPASTPLTSPKVANFTIIGDRDQDSEGVLLRHGTAGELYNFVITGPDLDAIDADNNMGECLEIDDFNETRENADNELLIMQNSIVACSEPFKGNANVADTLTTEDWFLAQDGNTVAAGIDDVIAVDGYTTSSTAAAADLGEVDSWFISTSFIGAVGSDNDWTQDWAVGLD